MNRLYEIISGLRKSHGITDAELARRVGIRQGLLSDLKKNEDQVLKFENLKKIADYFNVPLDYFSDLGEPNPNDIPPEPSISESQFLFALYGEVPEEIDAEDIKDIKKYAEMVRLRKIAGKKGE